MRLRNTFLLILSGASALTAFGCGDGGGGGKADDDASTCEGDECADGGVATGDGSSADPCSDGKKSGDETGVDCGGSCAACVGDECTDGDECVSGVCTKDVCAAPSCEDGVQNGNEEDVDCGGSCAQGCDAPPTCTGECPPTAGFTIATEGAGPTTATASSSATRGSARIASTRYDWGDGTGSGTASTHTYEYAGEYVVTQTVIDAEGRMATTTQAVSVTGGFKPVRFSLKAGDVRVLPVEQRDNELEPTVALSDDGLTVEVRGMSSAAVRTDDTIRPGTGVFYFEGEAFPDAAKNLFWGVGVATEDAPLDAEVPTALGATAQSFGVFAQGTITAPANGSINSDNDHYGFVVDYRGTNPVVYLLAREFADTAVSVRATATLTAVTKPLYGFFSGLRTKIGPQARLNTGADTNNHPFHFTQAEVQAALPDAVKSALVMGFARTHARPLGGAPVLTAPAATEVNLGSTVSLAASATDPDEGDVTDRIEWHVRPSSYFEPIVGYGADFTFKPTIPGTYFVEVEVRDSIGVRDSEVVEVAVKGNLAETGAPRMVTDVSHGERVRVTDDGQGVFFADVGNFKDGVRANRGLIGDFWYFEVTRAVADYGSLGVGLVTADADLAPYSTHDTPWSMSINATDGVWHNLNSVGRLAPGSADGDYQTGDGITNYGFAVDYRGKTPVVHVMVGGAKYAPALVKTIALPEVGVPVYPFAYSGNGGGGSAAAPNLTFHFAPPFQLNPRALLQAPTAPSPDGPLSPADANAVKLGWGL